MPPAADVGIFGGSGFSSLLDDAENVEVETPYGAPSAPLSIGEVGGKRVAFLPRHGVRHELPPHRIPYRANLWAMRELGVRRIVGPCASGALRRRPRGSASSSSATSSSTGRGAGRTRSTTGRRRRTSRRPTRTAPTCGGLLVDTAAELGIPARDGGTVVVVQGPRFSTRAESRWFRELGGDVINMTAYPEGHLARELELCYATIAMVTDYDVGVEGHEPVSAADVCGVRREQRAAAGAAVRGDPADRPAARRTRARRRSRGARL